MMQEEINISKSHPRQFMNESSEEFTTCKSLYNTVTFRDLEIILVLSLWVTGQGNQLNTFFVNVQL